MAALARRSGHPVNSDFLGVYGFSPQADLRLLWRQWLTGMQGDMPLAMCHVAAASSRGTIPDPIRAARVKEFSWLASDAFQELRAELSVTLDRWPRGSQ